MGDEGVDPPEIFYKYIKEDLRTNENYLNREEKRGLYEAERKGRKETACIVWIFLYQNESSQVALG